MTEVWQDEELLRRMEDECPYPPGAPAEPSYLTEASRFLAPGEPDEVLDEEELLQERNPHLAD